jgi:hypothetical protein|tara:strand:+ start:459 stop:626 length:168 start_codon:yes stop_codon:yes gene_type:complete
MLYTDKEGLIETGLQKHYANSCIIRTASYLGMKLARKNREGHFMEGVNEKEGYKK